MKRTRRRRNEEREDAWQERKVRVKGCGQLRVKSKITTSGIDVGACTTTYM
jgi:hypothetical protein